MSRIGKIPVVVPKEVKTILQNGYVHIEGPKGKYDLKIPEGVKIEQKEGQLCIQAIGNNKQDNANHGSIRAHLVNILIGVTTGHKKELEIQGIGFRSQVQGKKLLLSLGFSHPIEYDIPENIKVAVTNQTIISFEGADKQLVGQVASQVRAFKPVEPYKGKGIRYVGEFVRRKQGKSVTK